MPQTTSSSQPAALRRYANMLAAQSDQIAAEGRRLAAALDRLTATCREYPLGDIGALGDRAQSLGRRDAEIAGWVRGVAEAFVAADSTSTSPPPTVACAPVGRPDYVAAAAQWVLSSAVGLARWQIDQEIRRAQAWVAGGHAALTTATNAIDWISWNWAALRLHSSLSFVDATTWLSGNRLVGVGVGVSLSYQVLFPSLFDISGLIILEDGPRWAEEPVDSPADLVSLFEQGFWNMAFAHVAPELLLALSGDIEDLKRRTCNDLGPCANPRPASLAEGTMSPLDVFPGAAADPATGELNLPAWSMMTADGAHSAISSFQNEQISLFRIGRDEYLFAICGLDLFNMAVSPNGLSAVIQTAYDPDPMANPYYRLIKERFMQYLAQLPPGSTLNMVGHSMGGGMTMLLLNDPEVQAALASGDYTLRSVVLYGAVRPLDPQHDGVPPSQPSALSSPILAGTEVRIYVDKEDKLALNVGAGHMDGADQAMPNVSMLDNGNLDGATTAHTSYYDPAGYAGLPSELQGLPFHVDPRYWEHYRSPKMDGVRLEEWLDGVGSMSAPQTPVVA